MQESGLRGLWRRRCSIPKGRREEWAIRGAPADQGAVGETHRSFAGNRPDVRGQPDSNPEDKGKTKAGSLHKVENMSLERKTRSCCGTPFFLTTGSKS